MQAALRRARDTHEYCEKKGVTEIPSHINVKWDPVGRLDANIGRLGRALALPPGSEAAQIHDAYEGCVSTKVDGDNMFPAELRNQNVSKMFLAYIVSALFRF